MFHKLLTALHLSAANIHQAFTMTFSIGRSPLSYDFGNNPNFSVAVPVRYFLDVAALRLYKGLAFPFVHQARA